MVIYVHAYIAYEIYNIYRRIDINVLIHLNEYTQIHKYMCLYIFIYNTSQ